MYLLGAGGHAKVILEIAKSRKIEIEGFFDSDPLKKQFCGRPVYQYDEIKGPLLISIGNNRVRCELADRFHLNYYSLIAPSAIVSESAKIGEGSVVMQGAVVQAYTRLGNHVIINTRASVDHDSNIGDYVHIAPGSVLCGNVSVDMGTFIGAGSIILPGVKIGKWSVIGAGSVVAKDIPDNVLAYGNRCKIIKKI
ncbi:MAG: acetyltransferase [Alistipes sp.]|nr:acetyltransferase [Alistipes sp.]